jgi:hypothetical protein
VMHALFGALHLSVAVAWTDLDACSVLKTCGAQASVEKLRAVSWHPRAGMV